MWILVALSCFLFIFKYFYVYVDYLELEIPSDCARGGPVFHYIGPIFHLFG